MSSEYYTTAFYEQLRDGAKRSAEIIIPLVLELLPARSVVDVGCGDGSWLSVFQKLGVGDILGIEGKYVNRSLLQIPQECFHPFDLTRPFRLERAFDLAVSLEVAEHLPPDCAAVFVESLTRLAPFVLFSAAIPFQGGTHHVNEQWPDYWAAFFRERGYLPIDFVRKQVWQNDAVEWWYAQNTLLFAQANQIERNEALRVEFEQTNGNQLSLVHPERYLAQQSVLPSGVKAASKLFLLCLRNAVSSRLFGSVKYPGGR